MRSLWRNAGGQALTVGCQKRLAQWTDSFSILHQSLWKNCQQDIRIKASCTVIVCGTPSFCPPERELLQKRSAHCSHDFFLPTIAIYKIFHAGIAITRYLMRDDIASLPFQKKAGLILFYLSGGLQNRRNISIYTILIHFLILRSCCTAHEQPMATLTLRFPVHFKSICVKIGG